MAVAEGLTGSNLFGGNDARGDEDDEVGLVGDFALAPEQATD
jgi:hypothetical protein